MWAVNMEPGFSCFTAYPAERCCSPMPSPLLFDLWKVSICTQSLKRLEICSPLCQLYDYDTWRGLAITSLSDHFSKVVECSVMVQWYQLIFLFFVQISLLFKTGVKTEPCRGCWRTPVIV